jgi:hypothetical protein
MQFRFYYGREHAYRVWFQLKRKGIVNTGFFDIPVANVSEAAPY